MLISIFASSESMVEHALEHESMNRTYLKYIPIDINPKNQVDLFIGLHGYTGTASGFEKQTTGGFNDTADKYQFIVIYPQGISFNSIKNDASSFTVSYTHLTLPTKRIV